METIDQHRGLLHGGYGGLKLLVDAFVIDLRDKVNPNYVWQYLINCNRNGFASISFQNHPLEGVTEFVDYQNKDSKKEFAFFSLAGISETWLQTTPTLLTLTKENHTRYEIRDIDINLRSILLVSPKPGNSTYSSSHSPLRRESRWICSNHRRRGKRPRLQIERNSE